jgi:hypothetical protein
MATIPHYVFDNSMVALRKAHGIVVCAMDAAANKVLDRSEQIDYALWEASVLLEDAIFTIEDEVKFEKDEATGHAALVESIKEQLVEVVERFGTCPVVIPPNGSLISQIVETIRNAEVS